MPTVELVYDPTCPNVGRTRVHLLEAFTRAKLVPQWSEHLVDDPSTPAHARGHGSPTVLVDGRDVFEAERGAEPRCRLYRDDEGKLTGVPPAKEILLALQRASASHASTRPPKLRTGLAIVPAIGAALLPKVTCPACWPAYAGFLSALGLSFLMETRWLLPLTAVFLGLAVGALAFRAGRRRGYAPFAVGVGAAALVLVGKFSFDCDGAMYVGLVGLVAASLWNSWPRQHRAACPVCPTAG
jgi:mercuric ion transport protein